MAKKKILFICDGVVPTGFSTVSHNIIGNLPKRSYDPHHLAINYYGDPHDKDWKVYPAVLGGDIWGMGRVKDLIKQDFDGIFILNDPWVIDTYLEIIKKELGEKVMPIVVYFPVDAKYLDPDWFKHYDIVTKVCVYTKFGYTEVKRSVPDLEPVIIPHGVDKKSFYKLDLEKRDIKSRIYPNSEDFLDSFVVLNANRNQPRKRIDMTLLGFKYFAEDKPENVKLYCHMGVKDMGWDIFKLAIRLGLEKRLIVSNNSRNTQTVTLDRLNLIYNATEVGLNTSLGEGWSLTNMEHAVTGAVQVVPEHSALVELYKDCGIFIPIDRWEINSDVLTIGGLVDATAVADKLEMLYQNKELLEELSLKSLKKFASEEYSWDYIVKKYWLDVLKEAYG